MEHLTIIAAGFAILVPLAGFFAAWGGIRYASKHFQAEIMRLGTELAALRSQVHRNELAYVQHGDCRAIRDDCGAIHDADARTLCVKIDTLTKAVDGFSTGQSAMAGAIQGLLVAVGKLESKKAGG